MKLKHDPTHHKVLTVADPLRATVDQPGFSTLVHDLRAPADARRAKNIELHSENSIEE